MAKKQLDNDTLQETGAIPEQVSIPASEILADPLRNLRHFAPDSKEIEDLARSIVARGQLQPVGVRLHTNGVAVEGSPSETPRPYELLFGFRRVLAVEYANEHLDRPDLKVLARVLTANDEDAMLLNLDENLRRRELTMMDVSFAITRFKAAGLSGKEIGEKFGGKSMAWVSQIGRFAQLRPQIQKMIHEGKLPLGHARELAGMEEAEQDAMLAKLEKGELKTTADMNTERKAAKGGKRDKRGRKAAAATPSLKAVVNVFEALAQDPEKDEKTGKAPKLTAEQEWRQKVAKIVMNFLSGKIGAGAVGRLIERIS